MPCRSKSLTVVPRLALTPRTSPLKHLALYSPPLKRIIITVNARPYKTIVIIPPSSTITHHALKSPDSHFEHNSKRSRKIVTAPCRAKKLEKCHVKHFPLILTQALRPYLPADTDHVKEIDNSADRAPFSIPDIGAAPATAGNPIFLTITIISEYTDKSRLDLIEIRANMAKRSKQPTRRTQ